jgi:pentatricopeptide repeat protein
MGGRVSSGGRGAEEGAKGAKGAKGTKQNGRGNAANFQPHVKSLTKKDRFELVQKRKHAPSIPAVLRNRKRIPGVDREEDIPMQIERLKDAMYKGTHSLDERVLSNHWSKLLSFSYKTTFGIEGRTRPHLVLGEKRAAKHIGMPPTSSMNVKLQDRLPQMEQIFNYVKMFSPTSTDYTTMMTAYHRAGEAPQAIILYQQMKLKGIKPHLFCYNALIKSHVEMGNSAEAVGVLDEMQAEGRLYPDVVTYTTLISAFSREGDHKSMMKAYGEILKHELRPTVVTLGAMIKGLTKAGQMRAAVSVFDDFDALGIKPNIMAYNAIIWGVARKGDVKQARRYLAKMPDHGISPDIYTYKAMLNCFVVASSYSDALDLHAAVLEGNFGSVRPCEDTYSQLLNMMGNASSPNVMMGFELYKEGLRAGFFKSVLIRDKDRVMLPRLHIGVVPFAVQNALYSYVDRREAYKQESAEGLHTVSHRGLLINCGKLQPREQITEVQVDRATESLQYHLDQEISTVQMRVEAELQNLGIKYNVIQTENEGTNVCISRPDLLYWTMNHVKVPKNVRVDGADGKVEYDNKSIFVYKKVAWVDHEELKRVKAQQVDGPASDRRDRYGQLHSGSRNAKPGAAAPPPKAERKHARSADGLGPREAKGQAVTGFSGECKYCGQAGHRADKCPANPKAGEVAKKNMLKNASPSARRQSARANSGSRTKGFTLDEDDDTEVRRQGGDRPGGRGPGEKSGKTYTQASSGQPNWTPNNPKGRQKVAGLKIK